MDKVKVLNFLRKYKWAALAAACGAALLILPLAAPQSQIKSPPPDALSQPALAGELTDILSRTEGVGAVSVLLRDGAVVLCDGADDSETRRRVFEAVSAATGLGYDKISVIKRRGE